MSGKNSSGGQVGTAGAAVSAAFLDDYSPVCLLSKQFTATQITASVAIPSGVSQVVLASFTTGAPTTATVLVQGSNDGGNSWSTIPSGNVPPGSPRFTLVRLNVTITGGTSPTLNVAALVAP